VRVRQLDVTNEKGIQNLAREVEEELGWLDILVNNAGGLRWTGGNAALTPTST